MSYAHQEEFRSVSHYFYIICFTSIGRLCSLLVMKLFFFLFILDWKIISLQDKKEKERLLLPELTC